MATIFHGIFEFFSRRITLKKRMGLILVFLAGSFLFCVSQTAQAQGEKSVASKDMVTEAHPKVESLTKVVFHLDWDQEEILTLALENIKNLFKEIPSKQCAVRVVANGRAVRLFHKDKVGNHAADIEELHKQGVRFLLCRNALAKNKIDKSDLLPLCEIVPAGVVELINLQSQGFAYIKP